MTVSISGSFVVYMMKSDIFTGTHDKTEARGFF